MSDWSIRQQKYQQWLAAPANLRPKNLRTRKEVAGILGVTVATLQGWEEAPSWWDSVFATARGVIGWQLGQILFAMVQEAVKGSVQAQKLCLQTLGVANDRVEHLVQMQDDQLVIVIRDAAQADAAMAEAAAAKAAELAALTSIVTSPTDTTDSEDKNYVGPDLLLEEPDAPVLPKDLDSGGTFEAGL